MIKEKSKFRISNEGIDPKFVPGFKTYNGSSIPGIGMGTFGSDHVTAAQVAEAVKEAVSLGYRHIDCASVYGNEKEIGGAFNDIFESGEVSRKEMWITSKVWNDMHGEGQVIESCMKTLKDLNLEYLDLFLVHWPFPNTHDKGCDVSSRSKNAKPYIHEEFMKVWAQMEYLHEQGYCKHIGTSNMTVPKLELLLKDCKVKPHCNEMELHPHFQQPELFDFVRSNDIVPIGYCPIGSPNRPERDRTAEDTVDIEDPVLVKISAEIGMHPAPASLKWAAQRGQIPIPFSTKRKNLLSNIKSVCGNPFSEEQMEKLSTIDKNCRLIKGHVFLWEGAVDWKDLWDLNGKIST